MGRERRHFTDEFKRESVALLASSGRSLGDVHQREHPDRGTARRDLSLILKATTIGGGSSSPSGGRLRSP